MTERGKMRSELERNIRWLDRALKVYLWANVLVVIAAIVLFLATGAEG